MVFTDLRKYFITVDRPYKEGTVEVFEQSIDVEDVAKPPLPSPLSVYMKPS